MGRDLSSVFDLRVVELVSGAEWRCVGRGRGKGGDGNKGGGEKKRGGLALSRRGGSVRLILGFESGG